MSISLGEDLLAELLLVIRIDRLRQHERSITNGNVEMGNTPIGPIRQGLLSTSIRVQRILGVWLALLKLYSWGGLPVLNRPTFFGIEVSTVPLGFAQKEQPCAVVA